MLPRLDKAAILILFAAVSAIAMLSGPPSFDALDGAELTLAGSDLSLAHPPSYSLFLMALRLFPGNGYGSGRLFCAMAGGLAAALAFVAVGGSTGPGYRFAASLLLVLSPTVLLQTNTVEVYGPALCLLLAAYLLRRTAAGPYSFGLSVFGGHPLCILLAPVCLCRSWRRWWPSFLIPAGLLLYVPVRSSSFATLNPHYTRPETLDALRAYFGMYSGRLSPGSLEWLGLLGPATLVVMALMAGLAATGRPRPAELLTLLLSLAFISFYRVPDPSGMAFPVAFSLWLPACRGIERLASRRGWGSSTVLAFFCASQVILGVTGSWRGGDRIARTLACDMMRQVPQAGVYCTTGHETFHAAYLLDLEDRRPDLIPVDTYGNYFSLELREPFPESLGTHPVTATRAWNSPDLHLSGLIFRKGAGTVRWEEMDFFADGASSPDAFAMDLAAEAYARRAVQSAGSERDSLAELARSTGRTATTLDRLAVLLAD